MRAAEDAYGQQLLAQYNSQSATAELIERDDNYIDTGSDAGLYFFDYELSTKHTKITRKKTKERNI